MTALATQLDTELLDAASGIEPGTAITPLQQVKTGYTTAISVQHPRRLGEVVKRLVAEAELGGESFYYGWGAGKDRIEGPSINLAMAAVRTFGNAAVDMLPMQETADSWVMTSVFVDLETGFTLTRQFRQSKNSIVHGKHDGERKNDIRFQIGQSKAQRNVVLNALPQWLIDQAIAAAKAGTKAKIEKFVAEKGLPAAVDMILRGLAKHGVAEQMVLDKMEVAKREALHVDHLVMLRGDLHALDNGLEYASVLYPSTEGAGNKVSASKLNEQLASEEPKAKAKKKEPPVEDSGAPSEEDLKRDGLFES